MVGSSTTPPSGFRPVRRTRSVDGDRRNGRPRRRWGHRAGVPRSGGNRRQRQRRSGRLGRHRCGGAHAFSWTATGGMVDLGTLFEIAVTGYGYGTSNALAVNDGGQVVGWSQTSTAEHAFCGRRGAAWWISGRSAVSAARAVADDSSRSTSQRDARTRDELEATGGKIDLRAQANGRADTSTQRVDLRPARRHDVPARIAPRREREEGTRPGYVGQTEAERCRPRTIGPEWATPMVLEGDDHRGARRNGSEPHDARAERSTLAPTDESSDSPVI